MHTLKIETTTYSLASLGRIFEVQVLTSKITGKHKPVRPKAPKRNYPKFGDSLSTHAYVRDYFAMNAPGVYCRTGSQEVARQAGLAALDMFEPLSTHISIPQDQDSVEVEA